MLKQELWLRRYLWPLGQLLHSMAKRKLCKSKNLLHNLQCSKVGEKKDEKSLFSKFQLKIIFLYSSYETNLEDAKNFGVKKAITTNVSLGLTQFIILGTYALAFWYGTKLSVDEPENYSIGRVLTVSLECVTTCTSHFWFTVFYYSSIPWWMFYLVMHMFLASHMFNLCKNGFWL